MTMSASLRLSLVLFLVVTILSGSAWFSAFSYSSRQIDEQGKLKLKYAKNKQRYIDANNDLSAYEKYRDRYLKYKKEGLIGEEDRLSWIEAIESFAKELKLPSLRYEIEPQQHIEPTNTNSVVGIEARASSMKIIADVLHEGDFMEMLNRLKKRTKGNFKVKECRLTSTAYQFEKLSYRHDRAYISVNCSLNWYTVKVQS